MTSVKTQGEGQRVEPNEYCDNCQPVKHYDVARPYVNVKLCSIHAITTFRSHSEVTKQLYEAAKGMLYIFDRQLGPTTIGRRVCDEAKDAIAAYEQLGEK